MGNGQAPGIAIGLGVSGAGGAAADCAVSVSRPECRRAAGFFLAAFFLADFSVGFFLPPRPEVPARARLVLTAPLRFLARDADREADLRPAALPAFGRVSFFLLDLLAAAFLAAFLAAAFLGLAIWSSC
jgi:hypothetical protein